MNYRIEKRDSACETFNEKIPEFLAGSLSEGEFLSLDAHRTSCRSCSNTLEQEQRVLSLMAELPWVEVPSDFRDRVLRAWRVKRGLVREKFPQGSLIRVQLILGALVAALLVLPAVRISLLSAASGLAGAFDRLPPEYREGLSFTFELPTWRETVAWFQVWEGKLFEWLGNIGSAMAPWTIWLYAGLLVSIGLAVVGLIWMRSAGNMELMKKGAASSAPTKPFPQNRINRPL